jgi:hypothetical protein
MNAFRRSNTSVLLFLIAFATVVLAACGGGTASSSSTAASPPRDGAVAQAAARRHGIERRLVAVERSGTHQRRVAYLDRVRRAVIRGAARDFAIGTGIGGPSFEGCVKGLLGEALDGPTVANLVAVYRRPYGTAYAAQVLNALVAPLAARCGHRFWVPELVEAARGLRSAAPIGAAIAKLGVTYGPYLGMRCHRVGYGRCGRVGIDVVLGHAATRVEAIAGSRTIRLRTPGLHNGVRHRDWVGTFVHADFPHRRHHRDQDLTYVPVELRVHCADGRRARALFPHVLISSGWG